MFRAVLPLIEIFKEVIQATNYLIEEANLVVKKDGIFLEQIDEDRVAFVKFSIPANYFLDYDLETEEFKIGINLRDLVRVLKKAKDELEIGVTEKDNKQMFYMKFSNRQFSFPILDIEPSQPTDPSKLNLDLSLTIKPALLKSIVQEAKLISDDLTIKTGIEEEKIYFETEGEIGELYQFILDLKEDESVYEYDIKNDVRSTYSLSHLDKFTKIKNALSLKIECSTEKPIWLQYLFQGGINLEFLLAPRLL